MNTTNRIIFNTIVLYVKIVIVIIINLWTVPLLLRALGQSDYGLYQLVAGVIAMLSFLNAAMTVSTQRYMSVTMGEKDETKLNVIYNVSIILHLLIGLGIVIILELCAPFLFSGFLNIQEGRITAAEWIYQFLIVSTFFAILAVPFDAVLNAHENMIVFAIITIAEVILKLVLVFLIPFLSGDALIIYGGGWALITIGGVAAKYIYTRLKYRNLVPNYHLFDKQIFKEMFSFAGWNTFGSLAVISRNQGIAIVLNKFFGTIINASYGIANQISGLINYFSATLQKSINPQLMKSEGMKNRDRMLKIAFMSSKYSVLITLLLIIPLIVDMPYILRLWLHDFPEYTIPFARLTLIVSIIYQTSAGLMSAIQSSGRIRAYQLTMGIIILLDIPLSIIALYVWNNPLVVYAIMIIIEIVCLIVRICFAANLVEADWLTFCTKIVMPLGLVSLVSGLCVYSVAHYLGSSLLVLMGEYIINGIVICSISWFILLSTEEKQYIINLIPLKHKEA